MARPKLNHPSYVPRPKNQPSPEALQKSVIRPGSRLAVLGVFVEIVRLRFSSEDLVTEFPWRWSPDPNQSNLQVESAFNEDVASKNKRPAVILDIDEQVTSRSVLGDMAGMRLTDDTTGYFHLRTTPILVECVASKKVESASIADLVDVFLLASNRLIQAKFGFHDMTPTTVGRTQPSPRDKNEFVTPVTFTVQAPVRYTNVPLAPLLAQVDLSVARSGASSPMAFFESLSMPRPRGPSRG